MKLSGLLLFHMISTAMQGSILCTCLDGAVELVCPHDPRSYVGGALCPGRSNQAEQVAGGGARQKGTHVEIPAGKGWMN